MTSNPAPPLASAGETIENLRLSQKLIVIICAMCLPDVAPAQTLQTVTIPEAVSCPACRITSRKVLEIGSDEGPGALAGNPGRMLVDRKGRFWLSSPDGA
jgi:hypothetical protein